MTAVGWLPTRSRHVTGLSADRLGLALAGVLATGVLAAIGYGVELNVVLADHAARWADSWSDQLISAAFGAYVLALALIVIARARRNPIGWLLLTLIVLGSTSDVAQQVGLVGLHVPGAHVAGPGVWAGVSESLDRPLLGVVLAVLLLFPTGRLPSPRWRPVLWTTAVLFPSWFVAHLLSPDDPQESPFAGVHDPVTVPWFGNAVLHYAFLPAAGLLSIVTVVSLVVRYRAARADERQQLKWLALLVAGLPLGIVAMGVAALVGNSAMEMVGNVIWAFPLIGLPLAVTIAVTRYRLYDLDLVVNRTVVYGLVCAVLAGVYTVVVIVVPIGLAGVGATSPALVAAATLAAVVVASPARRRIQDVVDRLFGRRAWDARRLLDAFTDRWREAPQPPEALRETVAAALRDPDVQLGFWLRELRAFVDTAGNPLPEPNAELSALTVAAAGEPVARVLHSRSLERDRRLLDVVASSAVLVMENARLQAEVLVHVQKLEASRARIVRAADAERRRIERDLHDGAQQRLVALAVRARLAARRAAEPAPFEEIVTELQAATRELRELARGIHPAALSEGLEAAVSALAARCPLPVSSSLPHERLPDAVERTAYYVVAEALTNAVKHARAASIDIEGRVEHGVLQLVIRDDGCGGADPGRGSGLAGLADRVSVAQGRLDIVSAAGRGTTLRMSLPCAC